MAASLFTNIDYGCVPVTRVVPTTPPDSGTGPFLVDCDEGNLWVWACTEDRWVKITGAIDFGDREAWASADPKVTDKCNQVYLEAYYVDKDTNLLQPTKLTTNEFGAILKSCQGFLSSAEIDQRIAALGNTLNGLISGLTTRLDTLETTPVEGVIIPFSGVGGGTCVEASVTSEYAVVGTSASDGGFVYGEGTKSQGSAFKGTYSITNPFNSRSLMHLDVDYQITSTPDTAGAITSVAALSENPNLPYNEVFSVNPIDPSNNLSDIAGSVCVVNLVPQNVVWTPDLGMYHMGARGQILQAARILAPGETVTYYLDHWETLAQGDYLYHTKASARATIFGNYRGV